MISMNEWLNSNALRKYPIHEFSPDYDFPNNLFVDATILAPSTCSFPLYFSSIFINEGIIAITIKDSSGTVLGISTTELNYNADYFYGIIDPLIDAVSGCLTFGRGAIKYLELHGTGKFKISRSKGQIEVSAIVKTENSYVKSLGIGTKDTELHGDVKIKAGQGILLDYHSTENGIVISLESPLDFLPECYAENNCNPLSCGPLAITALNNVFPTVGGNITIDGDGITLPVSGTNLVTIGTPKVSAEDLCQNRTQAATGDPGVTGATGGAGAAGIVICGVADCCCEYCDAEPIEDCGVII